MNKALADLMERNLLEVFGQVDSARRAAAIGELYTADCTFFEAEEQVTGREALNAKVGSILKGAPGFVFRAAGPAQVNHDLGRLPWQLGPAGAPPVVTGTTLRSLSTEESEPCIPFLMNPRAPEIARAEGSARYYLCLIAPHRPPCAPDDRYASFRARAWLRPLFTARTQASAVPC